MEIHPLEIGVIDQAGITRITEIIDRMAQSQQGPEYHDFKAFNQPDREFHRTLVRMSQNTFLIRAWNDLHFHLHVGRLYSGTGIIGRSEALREHRAITRALQSRDNRAMIALASSHITHAERWLRRLLISNNDPEGKVTRGTE